MENVQRSVMLLRPDAHIMGQWDSGATLKLQALPGGGLNLSLKTAGHTGNEGTLALFLRGGTSVPAGEVTGGSLQANVGGVRLSDVQGAAVIFQGRFVLRSAGPDWPSLIARYRFAETQRNAAPEEVPEAAPEQNTPPQPEAKPQEAAQPSQEEISAQEAAQQASEPPQEEAPEASSQEEAPEASPQEETAQKKIPSQGYEPPEGQTPRQRPDMPDPGSYAEYTNPDARQAPYREPEAECAGGIRRDHIDPFPGAFPGSDWVKISYPGPAGWWHYIFGHVRFDAVDADVIGVPGEYSMAPPVWLDGFSTWVRCTSGDARGYWLMFQDVQTGQVLDINQSRRGG